MILIIYTCTIISEEKKTHLILQVKYTMSKSKIVFCRFIETNKKKLSAKDVKSYDAMLDARYY